MLSLTVKKLLEENKIKEAIILLAEEIDELKLIEVHSE